MISLKWVKSLTNFYWLKTNLFIKDKLIVLVEYLLNIVEELKNLEKDVI